MIFCRRFFFRQRWNQSLFMREKGRQYLQLPHSGRNKYENDINVDKKKELISNGISQEFADMVSTSTDSSGNNRLCDITSQYFQSGWRQPPATALEYSRRVQRERIVDVHMREDYKCSAKVDDFDFFLILLVWIFACTNFCAPITNLFAKPCTSLREKNYEYKIGMFWNMLLALPFVSTLLSTNKKVKWLTLLVWGNI